MHNDIAIKALRGKQLHLLPSVFGLIWKVEQRCRCEQNGAVLALPQDQKKHIKFGLEKSTIIIN